MLKSVIKEETSAEPKAGPRLIENCLTALFIKNIHKQTNKLFFDVCRLFLDLFRFSSRFRFV